MDSSVGSGTGAVPVFARKSSGLVRAASATDASFVNMYVATFPIMLAFILGLVLAFYPGANIFLTMAIGFVLAIPIVGTYAIASSVMKRSGGDYVFISRTIHPSIGFAANFVFVLFNVVFLTSTGYFFCIWGLSPLAQFLGVELNNPGLVQASTDLASPFAIFVVGELFVFGFALLFILGNIRTVLKVFKYTMVVSLIGLAVTAVVAHHLDPGQHDGGIRRLRRDRDGRAERVRSGHRVRRHQWLRTRCAVRSWDHHPGGVLDRVLDAVLPGLRVLRGRGEVCPDPQALLAGPVTATIAFVGAMWWPSWR